MPLYHLKTGTSIFELEEHDDTITQASVYIDWAIGLPLTHITKWARKKGYRVVPVGLDSDSTELVYKGYRYQVNYHHQRVSNIMRTNLETDESVEINWNELPTELKGIL